MDSTNLHRKPLNTLLVTAHRDISRNITSECDSQRLFVRSILQRSFGSDVWDAVATFFRSRILKVTIEGTPRSSAPNIVTTARIVQGGDDSSRFEVGLELPHESEESGAAEGRGKFPSWADFQSKK
jgi:hypothetical protein